MKKLAVKFFSLFFVMALSLPVVSFADDASSVTAENAALKNQVQSLSGKLDALERQVQVLSSTPRSTGTTYVPSPTEQGGALNGITVTGFVDTQYNNNFSNHTTNPNVTGGGAGNPQRSFDNNQNTFTLNNAEFDIEKLANPEGGAGFRVDMSAGEDIRAIDNANTASANNTANSKFGFQQAYVQLVAPLSFFNDSEVFGDTIDIKAGRMVTLAGAEVIEGRDNWNISRSYMFGLAIPFTHTGVRSTYKLFQDKLTVFGGLNNGWDANVDNNTWKTWETGLSYNFTDKLSYANAIYFGPEASQQNGHKRFVFSNVVSYQATERLATKAEFTFGRQNRIATNATTGLTNDSGLNFDNAQWWGLALYGRYAMTDKWGMATRFEYFRDKDRSRTGAAGAQFATSTLWAVTIGSDYKIYENLLGRVEYRYDKSNERDPFVGDNSHQSTIGAQLIYSFA